MILINQAKQKLLLNEDEANKKVNGETISKKNYLEKDLLKIIKIYVK